MTKGTDILIARSKRAKTIQKISRDAPILSMHVNMPGDTKNTPFTAIILNVFKRLVQSLYETDVTSFESKDGDYALMRLSVDPYRVKKTMIYLEDNHPIGRFIDLDVYTHKQAISRQDLNLNKRPCFICGENVNKCRRNQSHDFEALKTTIENSVKKFLITALKKEASLALRKEVYTYPCFGLVSHKNSGIHKDMNISHFLSAIDILEEAFETYLNFGVHQDFSLEILREQGKLYELLLLKSINVNTYKGAHYLFGLFLPLFIQSIVNSEDFDTFLNNLKAHAKQLETSDLKSINEAKTIGESAYKTHKIRGIRGELSEGLPAIFNWYDSTKSYSSKRMLYEIMARLDDTTLMKKDINTLKNVQKCIQAVLKNDTFDEQATHCLNEKISPGGAADMLSLVYFLKQTDYLMAKRSP